MLYWTALLLVISIVSAVVLGIGDFDRRVTEVTKVSYFLY